MNKNINYGKEKNVVKVETRKDEVRYVTSDIKKCLESSW